MAAMNKKYGEMKWTGVFGLVGILWFWGVENTSDRKRTQLPKDENGKKEVGFYGGKDYLGVKCLLVLLEPVAENLGHPVMAVTEGAVGGLAFTKLVCPLWTPKTLRED
jgi:hypothetical protein